ncbi:dynein axonemal assembly factor 10 isoform X2 [Leptinotarsa decemlineata]
MRTKKRKYNFLRGSSGLHGSDFQIKLLTLCLLRGLHKGTEFELSSENQSDAGAFDDIVYEELGMGAILMQAKHKEDKKSKIRISDLFDSKSSEFQLGQYVKSFCNIKGFQELFRVRLLTNISMCSGMETDDHLTSVHIDDGDILHCTQSVQAFALTETSRNRLRNSITDIPGDKLTEFLAKFQLICIQDTVLEQEIQQVLSHLQLFGDSFEIGATVDYIQKKIKQWYMRGSGEYLDITDAKTYLCLWRSLNYAQTFNEFNISFRRRCINPGKRLVYLVNSNSYILGLIKVYREYFEECKRKDAIIIVNQKDSLSIQREMVEAFANPECLFLIVPLFGDKRYADLRIDELLEQISDKTYKTVVLFSDKKDVSKNIPNAQIVELRICFDDLEESCQKAFLGAAVDFQGKNVSLRDVLESGDDSHEIFDEETLLKLSKGEKLKIEKLHDDEGIGNIYINREFVRNEKKYSEKDLCDLIVSDIDEKFILISDGAGMGKTTVLTKITEILQGSQYRHRWIIRLDWNRYANLLRKLRQVGKESIQVEDILGTTTSALVSNFQKKLFDLPYKVVLITDAVDEVNSSYTQMILKFLENCFARINISKIIVTTRPQLENLLEEKLNVSSFKLELFSPEDQIHFLTKYWRTNLGLDESDSSRCELYARRLMAKLNCSIGHASWSFIGIPLQTKMIGDIFQQGGRQGIFKWQGCREFLKSQSADVELTEDINVSKLYQMFVAKKGEIYIDKKCNDIGTVEEIVNEHYHRSLQVHKKIALQTLIDPERCQLFAVYRDANAPDEDTLQAMGIVHKIDGSWIFTHQTFAEYFMASCLWDELDSGNYNWQFLHFLLGHVFVSTEFSVVRSFFENHLANEQVSKDILEACGSAVGQIPWNESKNIVRLAEEGRINTLKLILEKSSNHSYLLQIEEVSGVTALHAASKFLLVTEYLVEKGADVNKKTSAGQSVLHDAVLQNSVDVVTFLMAKGAEIDAKLRDGRTPLHLAAEKDSGDVAQLLIHSNTDKEAREQNQKTPLHVAAENNSVRVAELLIDGGADVAARTRNGRTAMDLALFNKSSKIVKLLKDRTR